MYAELLQIYHQLPTSEDIGTTFITISWTSISVGSVTYTITYSTGDVMMSSITDDTNYTVNELTSDTLYRNSVVASDGVCEGEGKEMMADTNDTRTTSEPHFKYLCAYNFFPKLYFFEDPA